MHVQSGGTASTGAGDESDDTVVGGGGDAAGAGAGAGEPADTDLDGDLPPPDEPPPPPPSTEQQPPAPPPPLSAAGPGGGAKAARGGRGQRWDPACMDDLSDPAFQAALRAPTRVNVFFIRTSTETALGPLDACAVASAIEHNPRASVVVLSPTLTCAAARAVHPSLRIVRFTYEAAFATSPALLRWHRSGVWRGAYDRNNLGNALRLALLSLYGGAYFDTDMLSLRATVGGGAGVGEGGGLATGLAHRTPNFIGVERDAVLNNAALCFTPDHPYVARAIDRFTREFRKVWGWNGPALLTRTWQTLGNTTAAAAAVAAASGSGGGGNAPRSGGGGRVYSYHNRVRIMPQHDLYAIPFSAADDFFAPLASPRAGRWLESFAGSKPPRMLHVWNKKLKHRAKGIGKQAAAAAAAANAAAVVLAAAEAADGGGAGISDGDGGGDGSAAVGMADLDAEELGEGGGGGNGTGSGGVGGVSGGPSFVEYLMRHACPAYMGRAHAAVVAAVDAIHPAAPSLPDVSYLSRHGRWLTWPPGRPRAVAWRGNGVEPPPARGRAVAVHGRRVVAVAAAAGAGSSGGGGLAADGATAATLAADAAPTSPGDADDVCGVPGGQAVHVTCGVAVPLPVNDRGSFSWSVSLWFKATLTHGHEHAHGAAASLLAAVAAAAAAAGPDAPPAAPAVSSVAWALAPERCPRLRCDTPDCDAATVDVPAAADGGGGGAGGGGGKRGDARRRRRGRGRKLADPPPPAGAAAPAAGGSGGAAVAAAAAAPATATQLVGALALRVDDGGRLSLRFPGGLMAPLTKLVAASGTWRGLTLVYDSKQRRNPVEAGGGRIVRQSASLYLDGLLVSTRHASGVRMNATTLPGVLLLGTRDEDAAGASGAPGGAVSGGGAPRLLIGGVSVYSGHLTDQAVLELHNADVDEARADEAGRVECPGGRL